MLKTIAEVSPQLVAFILILRLSLSRPQLRHVTQVADTLITTEGTKTLSGLYRNIVANPCPKSAVDTFREAPWSADAIRISLRGFLVQSACWQPLSECVQCLLTSGLSRKFGAPVPRQAYAKAKLHSSHLFLPTTRSLWKNMM
jgi:hypothetical protein